MYPTPDTPTAVAPLDTLLAELAAAFDAGRLQRLVLAGYHGPEADLQRVTLRPVLLKGRPQLAAVSSHATRDITKNLPLDEALTVLRELLAKDGFRNAHLHTTTHELQLAISRRGVATLRRHAVDVPADDAAVLPSTAHDRAKRRPLDIASPFLQALGVTDAQQRLIPAMARKWKQINRFIEVFDAALQGSTLASDGGPLSMMDFGAGKGYLTFAMHQHLRQTRGRDAQVTGIELRGELVQLCEAAVERLGLGGLRFVQGDVRSHAPERVDVMIALHACDTATDHAIHAGIRAGASIIMCSPCCHKQLRPQLLSPHPLQPILQHGVHLGQQAEMLTDGLRALWLDACGYDTQVFEFISLEHTDKNKMILAVRRASPRPNDEVLGQIAELKDFYAIREHCLETLLRADGLL